MDCGSTRLSMSFWSVSCTPSSCIRSSLSPGYACDRTSSHSPSCRVNNPNEYWHEEHTSADLIGAVLWICELRGFPLPPTEDKKMGGFCSGQDLDDQPSSLYGPPMGDKIWS